MKLTIETPTYNKKITIEHDSDDLELTKVIEELVEPVLLGLLYSPETVNEVLYGGKGREN